MKQQIDNFHVSMDYIKSVIHMNALQRKLLHDPAVNAPSSGNNSIYTDLFNCRSGVLSDIAKKRQFDSSLSIVYVYSNFEILIDNLIDDYVRTLRIVVSNRNNFPKDIMDNHLKVSMNLLDKNKRFGYLSLTESEILENLYKTDRGIEGWNLNYRAYSLHSANLRLETLTTLFSRIGIRQLDIKILKSDVCQKYLISKSIPENTTFLSFIDELVGLRNDVSHGWRLSNIMSDDVILDMIDKITVIADSIYEIVKNYMYTMLIKYKFMRKISKVTSEVLKQGRVIVPKVYKNTVIDVGDKIIYIHFENDQILKSSEYIIETIQFNGASMNNFVATSIVEIGLGLNNKASRNGYVYKLTGKSNTPNL